MTSKVRIHVVQLVSKTTSFQYINSDSGSFKDVPGGFPKSDLLGVTVALVHVVGQQFLAV